LTLAGSVADNETTAPPDGAGAVSITVANAMSPPSTVGVGSESDARATVGPVTVNTGDRILIPLAAAVTVAAPGATAMTTIEAVDAPAATITDASIVATAGLLLESVTGKPGAGAGLLNVIVAVRVLPVATVEPFNVMLERFAADGAVGAVVWQLAAANDRTKAAERNVQLDRRHIPLRAAMRVPGQVSGDRRRMSDTIRR